MPGRLTGCAYVWLRMRTLCSSAPRGSSAAACVLKRCLTRRAPRRSPSPHGSSNAAARARTRPAAAHAPDGAPCAPQVFGFEPRAEPGERLTQREKRLFRSPAAEAVKSRQVHRARDRANTAAYKGAMLAGEGW